MKKLIIPIETENVSDGNHTFEELYDHRNYLFLALMKSLPRKECNKWIADCGDGWFLAGIVLDCGTISYHMKIDKFWRIATLSGAKVFPVPPAWDGAPASVSLQRLYAYIYG
jgi:hypothetical protein